MSHSITFDDFSSALLVMAGHDLRQPLQLITAAHDRLTRFLHGSEECIHGVLPNEGELWKLKEPVLIALKKDYAFQRVFRTWIADTDGHLRNFMRVGKGRTAAIDFDFAQWDELGTGTEAENIAGDLLTVALRDRLQGASGDTGLDIPL